MTDQQAENPAMTNNVFRALRTLSPYDTGWDLCRLGGEEDGAYLIPTCIGGIERCFSPGVCNLVDFEDDLARIFGIPSSTCDPEDNGLPIGAHKLITFDKFKIANNNSEGSLTLEEWVMRESEPREASLMLSMDIEGGEYEVIMNCPDQIMQSFRIITLEIHNLHMLWEKSFLDYFLRMIQRLTRFHDIVHMHPNNGTAYRISANHINLYTCIELTLLHKTYRLKPPLQKQALRHKLDVINVNSKPAATYEFMHASSWASSNP